jgi:transposase InsO family protein
METNRKEYSVRAMTRMLLISKSSYYEYRRRQKGPMREPEARREKILSMIKEIYKTSKGRYGSPRITRKLNNTGLQVSKNTVARLMRSNQISVKTRHKRKYVRIKTIPDSKDLVNRDFNPKMRNRIRGSDIAYIKTQAGWKYLAVVMDFHSRKIISWRVTSNQDEGLIIGTIQSAIQRRRPENTEPGNKITDRILIFHSDRGSQYKSSRLKMLLEEAGIRQSMGGKGSCYDNAVVESFFSTLKKELIYRERYRDIEELRESLFEYIEIFYNRQRIHSTLGYLTPNEFEKLNDNY